jgi:hypothetical protein
MKIQITVTEKQAQVILAALDIYSRLGMGQWERLDEFLREKFWHRIQGYTFIGMSNVETPVADLIRSRLDEIKKLVWDHPPNGSYSIFNDQVPVHCREAYDIIQVLRKAIAEHRARHNPSERWTVDFNAYLPTNPEWPPIQVTIIDAEE